MLSLLKPSRYNRPLRPKPRGPARSHARSHYSNNRYRSEGAFSGGTVYREEIEGGSNIKVRTNIKQENERTEGSTLREVHRGRAHYLK